MRFLALRRRRWWVSWMVGFEQGRLRAEALEKLIWREEGGNGYWTLRQYDGHISPDADILCENTR